MITVIGYKEPIQATEDEILLICDNCNMSEEYCNEDINIKEGYMRCSKLSYDLQNKNGEEDKQWKIKNVQ